MSNQTNAAEDGESAPSPTWAELLTGEPTWDELQGGRRWSDVTAERDTAKERD